MANPGVETSLTAANESGTAIGSAAAGISSIASIGVLTNLTVISNIEYLIERMNESVEAYKELSFSDEKAIAKVHEELSNADSSMATEMMG